MYNWFNLYNSSFHAADDSHLRLLYLQRNNFIYAFIAMKKDNATRELNVLTIEYTNMISASVS